MVETPYCLVARRPGGRHFFSASLRISAASSPWDRSLRASAPITPARNRATASWWSRGTSEDMTSPSVTAGERAPDHLRTCHASPAPSSIQRGGRGLLVGAHRDGPHGMTLPP